ncbi:MAG: patatin-like phospholipase family protein [Pseudomonadota bacterium]
MSKAPTRGPGRRTKNHKGVNIALQGGGAHGAYTWGVLDRLFEDDRIWVEGISGTSAGAMNAVVAAHGMHENGAEGARAHLAKFWRAVSDAARFSPVQRSLFAKATGDWSLETSPGYMMMNFIKQVASPYDFNPMDVDPLRQIVEETVDFKRVRDLTGMGVFLSATNVETGRIRVFEKSEITLDAVMASACLPNVYKAVEIDGVPYWDGGYMGNPPLFPFFGKSPSDDIIIVQINPVERKGTPTSASEIHNRMNEITFNSSLLHALRAIDFVRRLLDAGQLDPKKYKYMHMHIISACERMIDLDASSKMNAEWLFLKHLFEIGRETASEWLDENFDNLGVRSSTNIRAMFEGHGYLPEAAINSEDVAAAPKPVRKAAPRKKARRAAK